MGPWHLCPSGIITQTHSKWLWVAPLALTTHTTCQTRLMDSLLCPRCLHYIMSCSSAKCPLSSPPRAAHPSSIQGLFSACLCASHRQSQPLTILNSVFWQAKSNTTYKLIRREDIDPNLFWGVPCHPIGQCTWPYFLDQSSLGLWGGVGQPSEPTFEGKPQAKEWGHTDKASAENFAEIWDVRKLFALLSLSLNCLLHFTIILFLWSKTFEGTLIH